MARRLQRTDSRRDRARGLLFRPESITTGLIAVLFAGLFVTASAESASTCGSSPNEVRLRIRVTGLHSNFGQVTITVYTDDPKRFMAKRGKLLRERVPAQLPVTSACIVVPSAAYYAVSVYHDEDGNQKFNRTLIGLPDEGYGFSNNPKSLIGLPDLKDVRVPAVPGENLVPITIRY